MIPSAAATGFKIWDSREAGPPPPDIQSGRTHPVTENHGTSGSGLHILSVAHPKAAETSIIPISFNISSTSWNEICWNVIRMYFIFQCLSRALPPSYDGFQSWSNPRRSTNEQDLCALHIKLSMEYWTFY